MKLKKTSLTALAVLLLLVPVTGQARRVKLSNDIAWVMVAEAYKCCVEQAYLNAMTRLKDLTDGEAPGTWCVVLDADETIISNVVFQAELQAAGQEYSSKAWDAWCRRKASTLLPGAKEFCQLARKLGGKVIIITNRKGHLRDVTVANLKTLGVPFDACLLRGGPYADDRSKEMRRNAVEKGTIQTRPAGVKLPPLSILMLAGDQTHDLYSEHKSFKTVKDRFGIDYIIIPNPMYGRWAYDGTYFGTDPVKPKP